MKFSTSLLKHTRMLLPATAVAALPLSLSAEAGQSSQYQSDKNSGQSSQYQSDKSLRQSRSGQGQQSANYQYDHGHYYQWNPQTGEWSIAYGPHIERAGSSARSQRGMSGSDRSSASRDGGYVYEWIAVVPLEQQDQRRQQYQQSQRNQRSGQQYQQSSQDQQNQSYERAYSGQRNDREQQQRYSNRSQRDRQYSQDQSAQQAQSKRLSGEIEGFRNVQLRDRRGQQSEATLVKLKLDDGRTTVVNLGNLRGANINLEKGERIDLRGELGTINQRNVVVANELRADNQTYALRESQRSGGDRYQAQQQRQRTQQYQRDQQNQQGQQNQQQASRQQASIRGELEDYTTIRLKGEESPHTLVRLRMQDGESATVNLGPETSLGDLRLSQGDRVVIRGEQGTINGRDVIIARSIRVEGEQIKQQRTGS